jgi:hypothetical protein
LVRFKRRVREITRRAKGVSIETTIQELAPYMRGWRSYFGFCETPRVLVSLTSWGPGCWPGQSGKELVSTQGCLHSSAERQRNGSRPPEQWCASQHRSLAWFQVPCAKQWLTAGPPS